METEVETGSGGVGAGLRKGEFTGSIPFGTAQPVLRVGWPCCSDALCWDGHESPCLDYQLCL